MKLTKIAKHLHAKVLNLPHDSPLMFTQVSIDTRTLPKNSLFIAIKGENFDGHDFVNQAAKLGAIAAIVNRPLQIAIPQLVVENTITALGKLGALIRSQFTAPIVGITGSCGKTTTRKLLANILQAASNGQTLASEKSFNNDIGVPLTLCQLDPAQHQFAVLEIGASHHGEIAYSANLVKPLAAAVITNAAPCHTEGFGNVDGVAKAKAEIFLALENGGCAILNSDDKYYDCWERIVRTKFDVTIKILTFGLNSKADVRARAIKYDQNGHPSFTLHSAKLGATQIKINMLGEHNVKNALAAAAAAEAVGVDIDTIKIGLENTTAVNMRLSVLAGQNGATVINDAYNANPTSVTAAIDVLMKHHGTKILVLGDMLELGDESATWHQRVGEIARERGVDMLFTYGKLSANAAQAFGDNAQSFDDKNKLIAELKKHLSPTTTVVVKGSKSMKMWEVVEAII